MNNNFPPLMSDGRNFSRWEQPIAMDNFLKTSNNIKSNWEYRQYLANNADAIILFNQQQAVNSTTFPIQNELIPVNNFNSDLKSIYLSREELQNRMVAPVVAVDFSSIPVPYN